jgi:hypothetical protein
MISLSCFKCLTVDQMPLKWKAGELDHVAIGDAIHQTHKQTREVYVFFTQNRDWLVRIIQLDDA